MAEIIFNQPLSAFLDGVCEGRPQLEAVRRKISPLLSAYRDFCRHSLRVSDVYLDSPDRGGEVIAERFLAFVARQPLPPGRRPARHRRRKSEDKSALRRLMREYLSDLGRRGDPEEQVSLAGMDEMPEGWEVLGKILRRCRPRKRPGKCAADSAPVGQASYSFASQHVMLALREVSLETGETDLSVLMGRLYSDLTRAMRRNAPPPHHRKLTVEFCEARKRYFEATGQPVPGERVGLPLDKFPEPLKSQVERYRRAALEGFSASNKLRRVAKAYGIKDDPYRARSIDLAIKALSACLGHLTAEKGEIGHLGVEDLIKTRLVKIKNDAGKVVDVRHVNDNVESFRQKEWAAVRPSKRAEFDSGTFSNLRGAVIVVAAANGFEQHIPNFRKGYKVQLDKAARAANKAGKKKVFHRRAVDEEIARLKGEVFQIIDEGSFKMGRAGKDNETHKKVTKILLLVQIAVLRYLGYRQQCLRVCSTYSLTRTDPSASSSQKK